MVTARNTEIVAVASGKGGTGKTLILASLGYALQTSGHRVLFIDTDTATDGLSLFLLGPRGWEATVDLLPQNTFSQYLRVSQSEPTRGDWVIPFKVNRGRQDDHGQFYDVLISGQGLYGDIRDEISQSADPQLTREAFRNAVQSLFDWLRNSGQWDYVLVDTRGGFGFNTTDVCALSDSFFLVTEPDFTSFYQDKNLFYRISAAAVELVRKATLRGVIVNKATEFSPNEAGALSGLHNLDLEKMEASFRNALVEEFDIRYSDTHPVPLDLEAVQAYKSQKIPYLACPSSVFSYATLTAFSSLLRTVTVQWPDETTKRWNALVDRVSIAIKAENDRKLSLVSAQEKLQQENQHLGRENQLLLGQIEQLQRGLDRTDEIDKRQVKQYRYRVILSLTGAVIFAALLVFAYVGWKDFQAATLRQDAKLDDAFKQQQELFFRSQMKIDQLQDQSQKQIEQLQRQSQQQIDQFQRSQIQIDELRRQLQVPTKKNLQ
jgi:cellulose biosynthesis protein BcsQ